MQHVAVAAAGEVRLETSCGWRDVIGGDGARHFRFAPAIVGGLHGEVDWLGGDGEALAGVDRVRLLRRSDGVDNTDSMAVAIRKLYK